MNKIGVGMIGAGWMGATLLQKLTERDDTSLVGLHQRNEEAARDTLSQLGANPDLFASSLDNLLARDSLDAVFVCSTNEAHGPQSIAALEAGKHVFCEKPCATRFRDFTRQIELAKARPDQITFVDYLLNFDTLEDRIRSMTRDGDFGGITQIQVNYRHPINIEGAKAWKLKADQMGDAIGMGIIHSLSVMLNIMAEQNARPVSVFASNSQTHSRPFEIPAVWNLQIRFSNDATGFCFGNVDQANGYDAYHNIHGTKGGLIFDSYLDRPQKIRYWSDSKTNSDWVYPLDHERCTREGLSKLTWPESTTTPDSGDVMQHQTGACVDHFLNCIHNGEQSFLSFENSAPVAELGWAAQMSAARGTPVSLPLDYTDAGSFFAHEAP
ncbi:MAG: Gfo/Idh/MocA family oxidoreductase [Verrucomicrobiota bacterium]